jgi:hypothetical protein
LPERYTISSFSSIELACAVRQPGPCACFGQKRRVVPHVTLETPHFTLHTSSHLTSSEFFSPHLSSSHLFSSHLISSHMSSNFFSIMFISSEHCSTFLIISSKIFLAHLSSSVRPKVFTVRKKFCFNKTGRYIHTYLTKDNKA